MFYNFFILSFWREREREREFQVKPLAASTSGSPCGQRAFQEQSEALAMSRMQLTTTVLAKHMQLRRLAENEAAADAWHNPDLAEVLLSSRVGGGCIDPQTRNKLPESPRNSFR